MVDLEHQGNADEKAEVSAKHSATSFNKTDTSGTCQSILKDAGIKK
jgi:hypothetical protein